MLPRPSFAVTPLQNKSIAKITINDKQSLRQEVKLYVAYVNIKK